MRAPVLRWQLEEARRGQGREVEGTAAWRLACFLEGQEVEGGEVQRLQEAAGLAERLTQAPPPSVEAAEVQALAARLRGRLAALVPAGDEQMQAEEDILTPVTRKRGRRTAGQTERRTSARQRKEPEIRRRPSLSPSEVEGGEAEDSGDQQVSIRGASAKPPEDATFLKAMGRQNRQDDGASGLPKPHGPWKTAGAMSEDQPGGCQRTEPPAPKEGRPAEAAGQGGGQEHLQPRRLRDLISSLVGDNGLPRQAAAQPVPSGDASGHGRRAKQPEVEAPEAGRASPRQVSLQPPTQGGAGRWEQDPGPVAGAGDKTAPSSRPHKSQEAKKYSLAALLKDLAD